MTNNIITGNQLITTVKQDIPLTIAFEQCLETHTPAMYPLTHYVDERGFSLMQLYRGVLHGGQINYSIQYPGIVKAWHKHIKQTDFWCVLHGMLKVGIMSDDGKQKWLANVGEHKPGIIIIPPGLWHGAKTLGNTNAGLLYYVTEEYNQYNPDEQRQPPNWLWEPWNDNDMDLQ